MVVKHRKTHKKRKVKVLMGGPSSEHEVSLKSGKQVLAHLDKDAYEAEPVFISKKGVWDKTPEALREEADVAFIAMHGEYGEDGGVQAALAMAGIPHTGSDALTSALAMNKFLTGELLRRNGLAVPLTFLVHKREWAHERDAVIGRLKHYLSFPFVVKPNNLGSSVGVSVVKDWDGFLEAMRMAFSHSREALVQAFVVGKELTCGVLDYGWKGSEYPLLPTEIVPKSNHFFDYDAKYVARGSDEITPARIPEHLLRAVQRTAQAAHASIGARGVSRTDMIVDPRGTVYVLEVNTIPGMTEESLLPKAAAESGIPFSELLHRIIEAALWQ